MWSPEGDVNLSDYQKAIITYKGTDLKTDEENVIAFKTMRTSYRNYYRDQKPVSDESKTYEMPIPQGKGSLVLGIENKWDSEKGGFQNDFTFEVEKIELVKDADLAIDYGDKYTEEGNKIEFLHNINNDTDWSVGPNAIKWTSKEYEENGNDSGWAAGYWEFSKLSEYDMIAITVKGLNPNSNGMKFTVGGYLPYYEPDEDGNDSEFHSVYSRFVTLENENESVCVKLNVADICTYKDKDENEKTFIPKAIEFQNQSFEGSWGPDMVWGDDWTLVIEKIELIKGETYEEEINPADQENTNCNLVIELPSVDAGDIEVTVTVQGVEITTNENLIQGIYKAQEVIFTAPEGLGSYSWKLKLKGQVILTSTENTFEFNAQNLIAGEYYDLVLFTDDKSYTRQLKISE